MKDQNYQSNVFHRFAVRQQHIIMFIGFVYGRNAISDDAQLLTLSREWIKMFDLDIEPVTLCNSYRSALVVFKSVIKK